MQLVAIDPGEIHCGVATWNDSDTDPHVYEYDPELLAEVLESWYHGSGWKPTTVIEEFRLYPWKAQEQGYSQLKTVEVIGVVRHLCRRFGVTLVEQSATIKKPTFAQLQARGVLLKGTNQHMRDAEAHGWYYQLKGT